MVGLSKSKLATVKLYFVAFKCHGKFALFSLENDIVNTAPNMFFVDSTKSQCRHDFSKLIAHPKIIVKRHDDVLLADCTKNKFLLWHIT
jgi:hypothetical protein